MRPSNAASLPSGSMLGADFKYSPSIIPGIIATLDVVATIVAFFIARMISGIISETESKELFIILFTTFVFLFIAYYAGLYRTGAIMRPVQRSNDIIMAVITVILFLFSIIVLLGLTSEYNIYSIFVFSLICIVTIVGVRTLSVPILRVLSARKIIGSTLVILMGGEQGRRFINRLEKINPLFINVAGVFVKDEISSDIGASKCFEGLPVLGNFITLLEYARDQKIDDVVIALPWNADRAFIEIIEKLKEMPVNVYLSTDLIGYDLSFEPVFGDLQQLPILEVIKKPISGWGLIIKSAEDIIFSAIIIIITAPLLIIIAMLIKLDSPGPVFFMQRRLGFNNKEFLIYKFRSMYHSDTDEKIVRQAVKGDPRVTRVGRFIRSTSLDELPQLFNVLNGSMSLVGPRPHAISHNLEYGQKIRGYFARHRVKPGITGWAQVNGYRGETDAIEKMERRIQYDIYYTDNWSLLFDIKIIIMTLFIVIFSKNAY